MKIVAETEIAATPEAVWDVLSDTEDYQAWNPFIVRVTDLGRGMARVIIDPGGEERQIALTARQNQSAAPQRFAWRLRLGPHFLLNGAYRAQLSATATGATLRQEADFGGLMRAAYLRKRLRGQIANGLKLMGEALRRQFDRAPLSREGGAGAAKPALI